ncbi:MAG: ferric reductase-like transmembrane domain-containing protein [Bacteroidales bacterium]|jgi:DMSO/TMAO reductase YedYZ heme-binding membrane subunit|nr:ferric reductase-like transmembrane domain-containing protein [Bacteroidales bacterium]
MIKLLFDFIQFLNTLAPLLMALAVLTLLFLLLAKSIKKHAVIYYFVFAIPAILFILRQILSSYGITALDFSRGSTVGSILREYVHAGGFSFPLLIIIMYIGALPSQNRYVKRLMMIRKELSIISGFPILIHTWVRLRMAFGSFDYFFGSGEAVRSSVGAGFSNAVYMLGLFMAILFLVLWITSFDVMRKWLGARRWKKIQRWSYVLYAMLFIHSMGIQVGSILNPRGGRGGMPRPAIEVTATTTVAPDNRNAENQEFRQRTGGGERGEGRSERGERGEERGERGDRNAVQPAAGNDHPEQRAERGRRDDRNAAVPPATGNDHPELQQRAERGDNNAVQTADRRGNRETEAATPAAGYGRQQSAVVADIVSPQAKRYIHIVSLILIFGSYLYLRLRKAKRDAAKKQAK